MVWDSELRWGSNPEEKSPFFSSRLMIFTEVPSDGPSVNGRNPGNSPVEVGTLYVCHIIYKVLGPSQVVQDFFHQEYQVGINGYRKWVISPWLVKYSKNSDLFIDSHYCQWDILGGSVNNEISCS